LNEISSGDKCIVESKVPGQVNSDTRSNPKNAVRMVDRHIALSRSEKAEAARKPDINHK